MVRAARLELIVLLTLIAGVTVVLYLARRAAPASVTHDAPAAQLSPIKTGPSAATFAARLEGVLPALERDVAAGSSKARDESPACTKDLERRAADLDAIDRVLLDGDGWLGWTDDDARALAGSLHDALVRLRRCVGCDTSKPGCADAARAMVLVERRLAAYRVSGTAAPGGIRSDASPRGKC